jgi:hypothetical protein
MALGMWQGILAGLQDVDAKKAAREAKETELLEKRKGLALQLAAKYGTSGLGSGLPGAVGGPAGAGPSGGSIDHFSQVLKSQYGVSDEAILRVARTAGASGLEQATSILEKQRLKFEGVGKELPSDIASNLFDSAVLTGPANAPLDFAKLEEYIGAELDPLEKELVSRSRTQSGQAYFPEPAFVEAPKLEDVDRLEQRATSAVTQQAEIELRNLNRTLNELNTSVNSETDPEKVTNIKNAQELINARQMQVQDALKSAEGEGGNPSGLIRLYGNQFFQEVFKADPRFKDAVLSPIFRENISPAPRRIDSQFTLEMLVRNGVLKAGDTFEIYNKDTQQYELGELY